LGEPARPRPLRREGDRNSEPRDIIRVRLGHWLLTKKARLRQGQPGRLHPTSTMGQHQSPQTFDESTASFEQVLERLQGVVERLESGELKLEESLAAFEEGIRLARAGERRLDEVERRVEQLLSSGDTLETRALVEKEP